MNNERCGNILLVDPDLVDIAAMTIDGTFIHIKGTANLSNCVTQLPIRPALPSKCSYCGTTHNQTRCNSCGAPRT